MPQALSQPRLDAVSGTLWVAEWSIHWHSQVADLPPSFVVQATPTGCTAAAEGKTGATDFDLALRFEGQSLAAMTLQLTPPQHQDMDDQRFHASTEERVRFHAAWLRRQLNWRAPWPAVLPWGEAGVGLDKSGQAFVVLQCAGRATR
ncbi:MAG: hypothetical protein RLZZ618_593 [Pseudomonadota bacterium]|jgi:hypothetical protein